MLIYRYDEQTKEFLYEEEAILDPAELKYNNKKIYLIPANTTKTKPPKMASYEVALFDEVNQIWVKTPDYRGFYAVNKEMHPVLISAIGALPEGYIAITQAEAMKILEDELFYIIQDGKLINNPNYEEDKQKQEEALFNQNFFNTSLGYVRRKVTMKDGTVRDFLSDILSLLVPGVAIITYNRDLTQNKPVVTEEFLAECKQQMLADFYGVE